MRSTLAIAVAMLGLVACGRWHFEPTPPRDAAMEGGRSDAMVDAGTDAMLEAGSDAMIEAGMDAMIEAGIDATIDAPPDAMTTTDAQPDAPKDGGIDAPIDAGGPPRDLDYCVEVPRLQRAMVLDGVLEPGLLARAIPQAGWTATTPPPIDQPSAYAIAWQPDGLYFYIEVTDAIRLPPSSVEPTWLGDGVEVYVDADALFPGAPVYDRPGAMQMTIAAPSDDVTPVARAERWSDAVGQGAWTSTQFSVFPRTGGYALEALVVAADLDLTTWSLATGNRVGVDVGVNLSVDSIESDIDGGAPIYRRLGQYFARIEESQPDSCGGRPFCQPLAFCTPELID